ncbi:ferredoxin [Bacteroidota bacterium]
MAKFKIIYDREACIGAAACAAVDPKRFEMHTDGKADMLKAKEVKSGLWELEVEDLGDAQEAAEACPVDAIKIEKL